jgi:hypothetical protein
MYVVLAFALGDNDIRILVVCRNASVPCGCGEIVFVSCVDTCRNNYSLDASYISLTVVLKNSSFLGCSAI